jgi:hypothetical protein
MAKSKKAGAQRVGVILAQSEEGCEFTTLDVVNGLHGVCVALDGAIVNAYNPKNAEYLVQAAKVLSTMVRDRWMG